MEARLPGQRKQHTTGWRPGCLARPNRLAAGTGYLATQTQQYSVDVSTAEFYTVAIAVYAAVVATAVAIWDVVKWKMQGPNLEVQVQSGMKLYGGGATDDREFIVLRVTNRGDRPTTITTMGYLLYRDDFVAWWSRNSNTWAAIVPNPSEVQPLPFVLAPGLQWVGMGEQVAELTKKARSGCLMCAVYHSNTNKPIMRQVVVSHASARY